MEFVAGIDGAEVLRQQAPLSVPRAARIVSQLLDGLEFAHQRQFVHRDIKPGNLLLIRGLDGEEVKLADFGLARVYQASTLSGLTLEGETGGSMGYIAPEQITNFRESTPSCDIYAAAATMYHLLCGRVVYDLPKPLSQKVLMILNEDPIPNTQRRPDIPTDVAEVIHRGLQAQSVRSLSNGSRDEGSSAAIL